MGEEEEEKKTTFEPIRTIRRERRRSSLFFKVVIVILLLIVGVFYLWTELRSGGRLAPYVESPVKQITSLWEQIWGTEKEGLTIRDLNGYEEKTPGAELSSSKGRYIISLVLLRNLSKCASSSSTRLVQGSSRRRLPAAAFSGVEN